MSWHEQSEGSVQREYVILWNSFAIESNGQGVTTITFRPASYAANNLQSNTAYNFTITARNEAGAGQPSDQFTLSTSN